MVEVVEAATVVAEMVEDQVAAVGQVAVAAAVLAILAAPMVAVMPRHMSHRVVQDIVESSDQCIRVSDTCSFHH